MDTVDAYRKVITDILAEYVRVQYAYGDIQNETVFDYNADRYPVVSIGWERAKRIHGCLIHIDIINGNVWIQRDGTEHGIANDLVEAGVPKNCIVLAFHPPDVRPHTEFAVA